MSCHLRVLHLLHCCVTVLQQRLPCQVRLRVKRRHGTEPWPTGDGVAVWTSFVVGATQSVTTAHSGPSCGVAIVGGCYTFIQVRLLAPRTSVFLEVASFSYCPSTVTELRNWGDPCFFLLFLTYPSSIPTNHRCTHMGLAHPVHC